VICPPQNHQRPRIEHRPAVHKASRPNTRVFTSPALSTNARLDQIKATGAVNSDGTEATLGEEPAVFLFGPFPPGGL
jgi:hypothetical protein